MTNATGGSVGFRWKYSPTSSADPLRRRVRFFVIENTHLSKSGLSRPRDRLRAATALLVELSRSVSDPWRGVASFVCDAGSLALVENCWRLSIGCSWHSDFSGPSLGSFSQFPSGTLRAILARWRVGVPRLYSVTPQIVPSPLYRD